jgi:hypothetical protein
MDSERAKNFLSKNLWKLLGGLFLLALTACSPWVRLEPVAFSKLVPGTKRAVLASSNGIQVIVEPGDWPGEPRIQEKVTPIKITLENKSGHPLRVAYTDFNLEGPKQQHFAVLPPFQIRGVVSVPVGRGYVTGFSPIFYHYGFLISPYYYPYYPGWGFYGGPFYYDSFYNNYYYTIWEQVQLPTEEMLNLAIPEGVVQDKGRVEGFLYFQKVPHKIPQINFVARLYDAQSGEALGSVTIPFLVK